MQPDDGLIDGSAQVRLALFDFAFDHAPSG